MDSKGIKANIKILVVGCSGVGKTSFVKKWTRDEYSGNYKATILSEFSFKIFEKDGNTYRVQLWDIGGQDRSPSVAKIFAQDSDGCLVISDATKPELIKETIEWKNILNDEYKFIDGNNLPFVLVQNKIDLFKNNDEYNNIENLTKKTSEENDFSNYFLTSVKENKNISEVMNFIINIIIERLEKYLSKGDNVVNNKKRRNSIKLNKNSHVEKKNKCC